MKLQNCHGNLAFVSVLRWQQSEDIRALKDALENVNTQKSTSRRILSGMLLRNSENSELKRKNLSSNMFIAWSSTLIINSMNTVKNL